MHNRHPIKDAEQQSLLAEYKKAKPQLEAIKKYTEESRTARREGKQFNQSRPADPSYRKISEIFFTLHENAGLFLKSDTGHDKNQQTLIKDLTRERWSIHGQNFSDLSPEATAKETIISFMQVTWALSRDKATALFDQMNLFHHQSLAPNTPIALSIAGAITPDDAYHCSGSFEADYYQKNGKIYLFVKLNFTLTALAPPNEKISLPGTVNLHYELTDKGFKITPGYPACSNQALHDLILSSPKTISVSDLKKLIKRGETEEKNTAHLLQGIREQKLNWLIDKPKATLPETPVSKRPPRA